MIADATAKAEKQLALLGGTFDPIHYGHLLAAEEVATRLGLARVVFMPCRLPPHKQRPDLSPAEDRYRMIALAIADNPRFAVSRLELERAGPSYTIDTLRALRQAFGPQLEIVLLLGADAVLELNTWREPEAVLAESRIVAFHRPGYDLGRLEEALGPERARRVQTIAIKTLDISGTELRQRAAAGLSLRYLTPEPVRQYIEERGLYRTQRPLSDLEK